MSPMNNTNIKSGMEMMFGRLLSLHSDSIPLLLRTFACFVFHSDSLREDFNKITILQTANRELLSRLKSSVTMDPTEGVMTIWTGIPPHVNQNCEIQELLGIVKVVKNNHENQMEEIKTYIHDTFESCALENGIPTNASIQALLSNIEKYHNSNLNHCLDQLLE